MIDLDNFISEINKSPYFNARTEKTDYGYELVIERLTGIRHSGNLGADGKPSSNTYFRLGYPTERQLYEALNKRDWTLVLWMADCITL